MKTNTLQLGSKLLGRTQATIYCYSTLRMVRNKNTVHVGTQEEYFVEYFVNQFTDHVLLQDSTPIINAYLVQIWDVDGGHVESCSIESRPFTELLYYLHHHPAKHSINCIH
jgi:hypothetical protein